MNRLPDQLEKPWLTVAELAAITGDGEKAIRAALDAGQLPALRVGRYVRIPTAALLRRLGMQVESASTGVPTYTVELHREDGSWWATVRERPGLFAAVDDLAELGAALGEAIEMYESEPNDE